MADRSVDLGGGTLLLSDMRFGFVLLNEARYRAIGRLFGLPRDQANVATWIAALLVASAAHEKAQQIFRAPPAPAGGDIALGAASIRELLGSVAGSPARDTQMFGMLLTVAVLGSPVRRALISSLHRVTSTSRRMNTGFHHRYGYLVDPGHWRQHRADRREGPRR